MSGTAPRRSGRKRTEPERFRFSRFTKPSSSPPPKEGRLVFQTSLEPEPATPRTPAPYSSPSQASDEESDPLEQFKQDLHRMGGFAVVNDYCAADEEASYSND